MHELIFFIIGCLLGGIIGIVMMSLAQINHSHKYIEQRKDENK